MYSAPIIFSAFYYREEYFLKKILEQYVFRPIVNYTVGRQPSTLW